MNWKTFIFLTVLLACLGILIHEVSQKNTLAIAIASGLVTAVLIAIGASITLLHDTIADRRERRRFNENAKENLALMAQMQSIQNAQNTQLMKQVRALPAPEPQESLIIDDAIFSELE